MSFLQPLRLAALPLAALPIIIHLINQRRFQTIRWAAMMFLLAANRMSRGYARLRQWLILLFRVLAVAALILAVSRPLASGWLGLAAGGRADTTIILLDRSASMREQGQAAVGSKLETGRQQLVRTLRLLGSARWILIESAQIKPRELRTPEDLLHLPESEPTSASADIPALFEAARDYIRENRTGRTEIWICSDIRANDWNAESGRWQALRDSFLEFAQTIRFHLLAYGDVATGNTSLRVTGVRRQAVGDSAELLLSLRIERSAATAERATIPLQIEIDGARSELSLEVEGAEFDLKDHRIPIDRKQERGWGRVAIPADANPADNEYFFVFDLPVARRTAIVADDPTATFPLQLAATIAPESALRAAVDLLSRDQLGSIEWDQTALVLWHAPLPVGDVARLLETYLDRGGQIVFFPPRDPDDAEFQGIGWGAWEESPGELPVETWRGDQDLLKNALSGAALPVGQLQVRKYCTVRGEGTWLANLRGNIPLLARATSNRGAAYFCATTTATSDSSLASDGVVLYVMIQRALASGASVLGATRQLVAGDSTNPAEDDWAQLAGSPDALSTEYPFQAGVYAAGEKLLAVNRPDAEDRPATLSDPRLDELFRGLDFQRVNDRAGSLAQLIQEVWRMFLVSMMVALMVEAGLCLPKIARPSGSTP